MQQVEVSQSSEAYTALNQLQAHLNERIIGQQDLIKRMLIALLCDGHLLVEGAPGLAKTKAIKELAVAIEGSFHRIQFTPDLLPGDITGTDIYRPQNGSFEFQQGPIFNNLILADEINRAPAKVQSALLEAMAERQVTIGQKTYSLPQLFLVMATQNPIEQEGTYPLPEAQLDRFLMYVCINYPPLDAEQKILALNHSEALQGYEQVVKPQAMIPQTILFDARQQVLQLHVSAALTEYMVRLITTTRDAKAYSDELASQVRFGASPRGTIALDRCARAHAWLHDRDYVSPEDIHAVIHDVLRHRIILTYEAQAQAISTDDFIDELLNQVAIP